MVGVQRSKGCRTCRRKKKGCDLQKPICGQCARLGVACSWDEKQWTFVSHEPAEAGSSTVAVRSRHVDVSEPSRSSTPPFGQLQRSLDRSAFEIGSEEEFLVHYLPREDTRTEYVGGVYTAPWIKTLRDIATVDTASRYALNALALNVLGRAKSDSELLQEGTRMYTKALRETNKALRDPVTAQSDAVLACCKILSLYENFRIDSTANVSSQGQDWQKHVEGTCHIVELRGPMKHISYHGQSLFENVRIQAVIQGITQRKATFVNKLAWNELPWQTSTRNLYDQLVDIAAELPHLLQEHDEILQIFIILEPVHDFAKIVASAQNHINRCIRIGDALRSWEQKALLACLDQHPTDPNTDIKPSTLLEVCKHHGYGFFNASMQYWVFCMVLYSATWIFHRKLTSRAIPNQSLALLAQKLPDVPRWMNPHAAALNVVTCAPHFFEEDAGFWGAQFAQFPIGATLHYFAAIGAQDSEEMRQLRQLLGQAKLGSITSAFLRSIANTATAKGDPAKLEEHVRMASSWFGTGNERDRRKVSSPLGTGISDVR